MADELVWYDAGKTFPPMAAFICEGDNDWYLTSKEILCKQKNHSVSKGACVLMVNEDGEICVDWGSELCETNDDAPIVAWAFIPEEEDDG